jgi:hypothetical protein
MERRMESVGAVVPGPQPPFRLVVDPKREYVIDHVEGDRAAFNAEVRSTWLKTIGRLRFGGFRWSALDEAVRALRGRNIDVFLLEVPVSEWLISELRAVPQFIEYRMHLQRLVAETGAVLLSDWPPDFSGVDRFWDESHMNNAATERFTHELASRLVHAH